MAALARFESGAINVVSIVNNHNGTYTLTLDGDVVLNGTFVEEDGFVLLNPSTGLWRWCQVETQTSARVLVLQPSSFSNASTRFMVWQQPTVFTGSPVFTLGAPSFAIP